MKNPCKTCLKLPVCKKLDCAAAVTYRENIGKTLSAILFFGMIIIFLISIGFGLIYLLEETLRFLIIQIGATVAILSIVIFQRETINDFRTEFWKSLAIFTLLFLVGCVLLVPLVFFIKLEDVIITKKRIFNLVHKTL